ncbi:uncharacterized protein LOC143288722 [Babylonia areolata]|uniref:uncharacterized protein LOC143288722 n=1 Tax=Babylonia areolata TaxID=304850 RepID=UPI003FD0C11C
MTTFTTSDTIHTQERNDSGAHAANLTNGADDVVVTFNNVSSDADVAAALFNNISQNVTAHNGVVLALNVSNATTDDVSAAFLPGGPPGRLNEVALFLMVYFLPVIFILGILGNSVSFVVFLSEKMRRVSTNVYLAALSASNSVFLLAVGVSWTDMVGWKLMHVQGLCQATVYLTYCSGFVSVWLVVCITVENFIINFFLHRASCHCTIRRALSLVLLLNVTAFLLYDFAIWTTGVVGNNDGSRPQFYCQTYLKYQEVVEVFTLIDVAVTLVIPSALILILVVPTCVRNLSCQARAARLRSIVLSRRERALLRVTRLLCVIIVSYVLLTAPSHLNKLRHLLGRERGGGGGGGGSPSTDMIIVFIVQTLYFLSFSMNFVYFLIWGKNFRDRFCFLCKGLCRVLCRCRQKLFRDHIVT